MYETLWFARVYEWLAVLVLALWAMMQARGNLRPYVETTEAASAAWNEWDRHQQLFDNRPDSRWDLLERWRQRFVYHEEWTNMWAYLTGLMCRNAAPPEICSRNYPPFAAVGWTRCEAVVLAGRTQERTEDP